jgi:F-type H+-transporting ATPase subunit alpha
MQGRLGRRIVSIALTTLVIAQTQSGNLNAHIPPNLISITDRQICQDSKLFYGGHHPAVDVGKSVSRVGGKAQAGACARSRPAGGCARCLQQA